MGHRGRLTLTTVALAVIVVGAVLAAALALLVTRPTGEPAAVAGRGGERGADGRLRGVVAIGDDQERVELHDAGCRCASARQREWSSDLRQSLRDPRSPVSQWHQTLQFLRRVRQDSDDADERRRAIGAVLPKGSS